MKTIEMKDKKAVAKFAVDYLERMRKEPEKYMPMCCLCSTERSYILMVYEPEGEERTALFGVCQKCCPDPQKLDQEVLGKIIDSVKKRMGTGDDTLHVTQKEWVQ